MKRSINFKSNARKARNNNYGYFILGLVILVGLCIFLFMPKIKPDEVIMELIGSENISIGVNSDFLDEGFKISKNGEELDRDDYSVEVNNSVDTKILGNYEVVYNIKYDNKDYKIKRKVQVVDAIAPVITVESDTVEQYFCKKDEKINLDFQAIDNYDGVITDKVKVEQFTERIDLSITDSSGNKEFVSVPVVLTDEPSPIINLKGNKIIYLMKGNKYKEYGATAVGGCGESINEKITISSDVDINKSGEYTVTYSVKNWLGEDVSTTRKVIVYDKYDNIPNKPNKDKVIYLTFDDGPGKYTEELLDILKKYNVKATFFVTNQFTKYTPLIKREYEEGHAIGVHTLTHKWSIYRSVETYVKDFNDMNDLIEKYTGKRSTIFRFPGGSSNTVSRKYATGVVSAIRNKMNNYGYVYFDWNVDSEDAAYASSKRIYDNVVREINKRKYSVILMHDIKKNTVDVMEDIINYALANGFTFEVLTENAPTVHHGINN